jgi:hypothetical protein
MIELLKCPLPGATDQGVTLTYTISGFHQPSGTPIDLPGFEDLEDAMAEASRLENVGYFTMAPTVRLT